MIRVEEPIEEIAAKTGTSLPNRGPYTDCTGVMVAWNEEARMPALLKLMKRWFSNLVVGVQESTDSTLKIAESLANRPGDQVLREPHLGYGDASMDRIVSAVRTPWLFDIALDEMPSKELLESMWTATAYAESVGAEGVWIPFHTLVDGVESVSEQQDPMSSGHLRLFRRSLGWPKTLHSRPSARIELWWPYGRIDHVRSLDEMMQDYLRYFQIGKGNRGWEAHNILMMHDACVGVAAEKGWPYVQSFAWWSAVRDLAFEGKEPDG